MVAEKHMVCRSFGRIDTIRRIAGRNPMSSMRSASSRINTRRSRKCTSLRERKSSSRPGVATTILAPLRKAESCKPSDNPPTTSAAGPRVFPRSALYCATTCMANSRVGTSARAVIPGVFSCSMRSMTGIKNASVLPVPVCAVASTSFPASACGIAVACTGVGTENLAKASRSWV